MKNFVLTFLFFALIEIAFASSSCKNEDLVKITSCYQDAYGKDITASSLPLKLAEPVVSGNATKAFWGPVCEKKQRMNDCIGKNVIESCYNIQDIQKLPIVIYPFLSKFFIANFLHMDYICDKVFKFTDSEYICNKEVIPKINQVCPSDVTSCETINNGLNCAVEATYKECGKVVGCFQRKNTAYALCYNSIMCNACDDISATNNHIDYLCHDDDNREERLVADIGHAPLIFN